MKKHKVRSQKQRRSKVIQLYVGVALFTALQFGAPNLLSDFGDGSFILFGYVSLVMWLTVLLRPLGYAKESFFSDEVRLDERQQLIRYRAHRITFYVTLTLIAVFTLALLIYSLVLENVPIASLTITEIFRPIGGGLVFLLIVHYTMPLAVIAWLEPDPISEDSFQEGKLA